jgi:hypothetical protein
MIEYSILALISMFISGAAFTFSLMHSLHGKKMKNAREKKEDIIETLEEMRDSGVCENLRMQSEGPARADFLWTQHEDLAHEIESIIDNVENI